MSSLHIRHTEHQFCDWNRRAGYLALNQAVIFPEYNNHSFSQPLTILMRFADMASKYSLLTASCRLISLSSPLFADKLQILLATGASRQP